MSFLTQVVEQIATVRGVRAVVLGGSRARGTHTASSDYDIGIYYDDGVGAGEAGRFDIVALNQVAQTFDDEHRANLCTEIGGWGPWVTGGGWLVIDGVHCDFIYRGLNRVRSVVEECCAGQVAMHYQPGHPAGYSSAIYMGEVAVCQPLHDPYGDVAALKAKTHPYPAALKQAIINKYAWETGFSMMIARGTAERGDPYYLGAHFTRAITCMVQTLFAINEQWLLNEKASVKLAAQFARTPANFAERIQQALAALPQDPHSAIAQIEALDSEVRGLI